MSEHARKARSFSGGRFASLGFLCRSERVIVKVSVAMEQDLFSTATQVRREREDPASS